MKVMEFIDTITGAPPPPMSVLEMRKGVVPSPFLRVISYRRLIHDRRTKSSPIEQSRVLHAIYSPITASNRGLFFSHSPPQ